MKTIPFAALLAAGAVTASAAMPLGRGELSAQIVSTAVYDSNVFGTSVATGDFSGSIGPRLSYRRKAGQIEADANVGISFVRYLEQEQLNDRNLSFDGAVRFDESNLRNYSGYVSASYVEASEVSRDVNARIDTETASGAAHTAIVTTARSNLTLDGNYSDTARSLGSDQKLLTTLAEYDYRDFFYGNTLHLSAGYDKTRTSGDNSIGVPLDQESILVSAGLERAFSDSKLRGRINFGYRFLNRSAAETASGDEHETSTVFSASLIGPFLPEKYFPKMTSQITIAYDDSPTPGVNDTGGKELTGSLTVGWQARENTQVSFSARRNQHLSVDDLSVVSTAVDLTVSQKLRYNLTGSITVGYEWSSYRGTNREDETASVNAGLNYHFARAWDARLSYVFTSTDSTIPTSTYDRHLVTVGVTYQF